MKRRIYANFIVLVLFSLLLLSASVSVLFYNAVINQEIAAVKDRARLAADLWDKGLGASADLLSDYTNRDTDTARLTIIASDGTVLLDNKATVASMENHGDREEFVQAILTGSGEATRYSGTLGISTYYFAIRLDDGSVLRVSKDMSKITGVFGAVLPAIITVTVLVLVLAGIVSRKLTKAILEPIGWINLDGDSMDIYDELTPYVKKINQQKKEIDAQMEALKYRISTIEVITGSMKEGLLLIDKDRTVLIANQSVSDIFDEKEIAQKNILHVCRDIEFQQGVKQCLSGVVAEILFRRGGRLYNVYFDPVYNGSEINGGAILFFDCTEQHEAEKQRREFSANVSHELKTPLTSISALAEMIANGIAKEGDIQAFAEKIKTQTQHLIHIIEDIIRLSEFDEGNANRDYSAFDLKERTASVIDVLREKAAEKNVAITLEGEKISLTANKRMMDELMYNLLDNAIKYNREGGSVSVVLAAENSMCKIIVSDTGIGIPKEQQSRVFERFYRVDASRYKKTGGTGLGLSIVKHIAEHHGGRVELESAEGEGTRVVCWLGGSG